MHPRIKTPDQRLRVFVSSTLIELAEERRSVKDAIISINLIPVMFELGARPYAPRDLYTAYLQQSHIFVGIYWQSYGWVAPDMEISGLEDEFILSENMPRLIYIKEPSNERDPGLKAMISKIQNAGVSYKTFRELEELRTLVSNDLSLLITERFELTMNIRAKSKESDTLNENFPIPATSLIGREKIIAELVHLIRHSDIRLITLSGTGGMGKSRVGLEVINRIKNQAGCQVCFVPLAALGQPQKLLETILKTAFPSANLAIPAQQLLIDLIHDQRIFMVLDNFEHLVESRLDVLYLLERCPNLKILVTSREVLHITGEYEYSLPPLEVPTIEQNIPNLDQMSESVRLFLDRARSNHPNFTLSPENYEAINEICNILDGIPLAIELAAARTRLFSPTQLAKMLRKNLNVLKANTHDMPERHQTLNATVEWSYNLLSEQEQNLLCMLSVLYGGGSLEAAAYIGVDQKCNQSLWDFPRKSFYISTDVFATIQPETSEVEFLEAAESLLSKSLAYTSVNKFGSLRINIYRTIKHYCAERLEEKELTYLAKFRHCIYYLYLAEGNWSRFKSKDAEEAYESIDNDLANIENALEWALENEPILGLRLATAMAEFWDTRGSFRETLEWIPKLSAKTQNLQENHFRLYFISQFELARAFFRIDDFDKCLEIFDSCLKQAQAKNMEYLIADAHLFKSLICVYASRLENKEEIINLSVDYARNLKYDMALLEALQHKAADRIFNGRVEEGIPVAHESLLMANKLNAARWEAISLFFLGFGYLMKGELDESEKRFKNALEKTLAVNDLILPVYSLLGLSQIALHTQKLERACLLIGAIDTYIKKPGVSIVPMVFQIYGSLIQQLNNIEEDHWLSIIDKGRALKLSEALNLALDRPEKAESDRLYNNENENEKEGQITSVNKF